MNHQTFGGFSRLYFRYVIKSRNAGQPAEQQARLIAMPSRGCSSAQAKERFIFFLIMWAPRRGAVLHEVRPYGGEGLLVVSMSSIMSVMSRESREYIFRGA